MTGYWKIGWIVTFGLFHFIDPTVSHTHTLPVHCCINRLTWLVCFSRACFANLAKSWLWQWGPWRALDGRYGSNIHPCVSETLLGPLCLSRPMTSNSWTHRTFKKFCWKLLPTPRYPYPPTQSPLYVQSVILQHCKKVAQNPAVLDSCHM